MYSVRCAGFLSSTILPERHIISASFKIGSFAEAHSPIDPIPLAGEEQMKARMRATARAITGQYAGSLLGTLILTNDVMRITATAEGLDTANHFLSAVIDKEVAFHNGRLDKLLAVQDERRVFLEQQIDELSERVTTVTRMREQVVRPGLDVGTWILLQQARMETQDKIAKYRSELNAIKLVRPSDLFTDTSAVVQQPELVVSSRYYRPVVFAVIGLGVGVVLTVLLVIVSIVRSLNQQSAALRSQVE